MSKPTIGMLFVRNNAQTDKIHSTLLSDTPLFFRKYLYGKHLYFICDGACSRIIHVVLLNQPFNDYCNKGTGIN